MSAKTNAAFQEHLKATDRTETLLNYRLSKMKPGYLKVSSKNMITSLSKSDYERETRIKKSEVPLEDTMRDFFGEEPYEGFRRMQSPPTVQDNLGIFFQEIPRYFFLSESGELTRLKSENWN